MDFDFWIKYLFEKRMRNDIKAIRLAQKGYLYYGNEIAKETGILDYIIQPRSINEISNKLDINNIEMLEALLDFLTGGKIIEFANGKYYSKNISPINFSPQENRFITENYNDSQEWTFSMLKHASDALRDRSRHKRTGFEDKESARLWDGVMNGPLLSLRKLAITKLLKECKPGSTVLDLGCGSGTSAIEVLRKTKANVVGIDASEEMLDIARKRTNEFTNRANFITQDLSDKIDLENKVDTVFSSLLINHIPRDKRKKFFNNISRVMKPEGKLVIFQLVNRSKFERVFSDWLLFVTPTHYGFPLLSDYNEMIGSNFSEHKFSLNGSILIATKPKALM